MSSLLNPFNFINHSDVIHTVSDTPMIVRRKPASQITWPTGTTHFVLYALFIYIHSAIYFVIDLATLHRVTLYVWHPQQKSANCISGRKYIMIYYVVSSPACRLESLQSLRPRPQYATMTILRNHRLRAIACIPHWAYRSRGTVPADDVMRDEAWRNGDSDVHYMPGYSAAITSRTQFMTSLWCI